MSIKSGQNTDLLAIGTTDTTLANPSTGQSYEFYVGMLHNTAAPIVTVELFLSSDATSASGERVDYRAVDPNDTVRLYPIVVPAGYYLIGKADTTGANFYGVYTLRTGTDV